MKKLMLQENGMLREKGWQENRNEGRANVICNQDGTRKINELKNDEEDCYCSVEVGDIVLEAHREYSKTRYSYYKIIEKDNEYVYIKEFEPGEDVKDMMRKTYAYTAASARTDIAYPGCAFFCDKRYVDEEEEQKNPTLNISHLVNNIL